MAQIVRTLMVSGAAVGLIASAASCSCSIGSKGSNTVSKSDVQSQITAKMTDGRGNKPDSVKCPSDLTAKVGSQLNCDMKVKDRTFTVNVTVTSVEGKDVKFDMVKVVDKNDVASTIGERLSQRIGTDPDAVTCPDNLKGYKGATLKCQLADDGKKYAINVTVTSVDGLEVNYDYVLNKTPE